MLAVQFYDVVLWVHITAVVTAFGALFAYPLFLAVNAKAPLRERAGFHRLQIAFSKKVTGPAIGVILLAGAYLATDRELWDEPWVTISLVMLFAIAGLGATILRRNEEGMLSAAEAGDAPAYALSFGAARTWTLITLAMIVVTLYVMTAKPFA
ncbi:MAG: hypothetical protein JWO90_289 [Solirubrobacterales bacterium]|jgi:hypothetical protein|nr:hypothetical protein [Solirubrobacterales bacterium]